MPRSAPTPALPPPFRVVPVSRVILCAILILVMLALAWLVDRGNEP